MNSDDARRPSPRAVGRFASEVGTEVGTLRSRLEQALLEAERLEAVGRHDLAVHVLEEQRDVLATVHQRLAERLAEAAVEREAERVVRAAAPTAQRPERVGDDRRALAGGGALRLLASAAVAVVGVVLLVVPEVGGGMLTVAGWTPTGATAADPTPGAVGTDAAAEPDVHGVAGDPGRTPAPAWSTGPLRGLSVPEAYELPPSGTADAGGMSSEDGAGTALPGLATDVALLEGLVGGLINDARVAAVVDAARRNARGGGGGAAPTGPHVEADDGGVGDAGDGTDQRRGTTGVGVPSADGEPPSAER